MKPKYLYTILQYLLAFPLAWLLFESSIQPIRAVFLLIVIGLLMYLENISVREELK